MSAKKKRKRAKEVQQRKPLSPTFPTDEESIELRRATAEKEGRSVKCLELVDEFRGRYQVDSAQWEHPYTVEIRDLQGRFNSCSCQDFRMNWLGTCKHIERALQKLSKRKKRRFAAAADQGGACYEVFFDARSTSPKIRLLRPGRPSKAIESKLDPLFGADEFAIGGPLDAWAAIDRTVKGLSPALKKRIRMSRHAEYWLERERFRLETDELRRDFDRDVSAGKRSDNPVNLPLYPYQKRGMVHLAFTGRALLADEMGLGKTVQAIAAAELLRGFGKVRRVLIVCPASLKAEWEDQLRQFTEIQAQLIFGKKSARLQTYALENAYSVCNYEQIRSDVDDINRLLVPDLVVLDEAQRIKNWPTKTAKTIKRLQSPYAFILTGTPLENRIEELYSLVEFVDPHLFGSLFRFQRQYMDMTDDHEVVPKNLDHLHRTVSRVMLRRKKADVEDKLPGRTDKTFFVSMTHEQRNRYAELAYEAGILASIAKRRSLTKAEMDRLLLLLGCMRMTCDTPYILDKKCRDCPKLEELENILDELLEDSDTKVLVFSEWVRMLNLVKELLDAKKIGYTEHTGLIPQARRREHIRRFKTDVNCRVFLSSESGGAGLNLQAANVVINLDLPWNPAKLEQRIARAWRKHQQRSVRVINVVAEHSIEHEMIGKLAYKSSLADSVLDGAAFQETPRSEADRQSFIARVSELLGGEAPAPMKSRAPKPSDLKQELIARHADGVLGIEQHPDTGATLVVARPGSDGQALRETAAGLATAAVEVITPETKALLLRLEAMGMLSLSPGVKNVHAHDGYTPLQAAKPRRPRLHVHAARKHWNGVENECKALRALVELDLAEQALSHLLPVLRRGTESLHTLYSGTSDSAPTTLPDSADFQHVVLLDELNACIKMNGLAPGQDLATVLQVVDRVEAAIPLPDGV